MRLSENGYFPSRYQRDVPDERDLRFASTNNLTERALAGFLLMSLFSSSFRIIWCIVSGVTLKNLCKSASAGGLPFITV